MRSLVSIGIWLLVGLPFLSRAQAPAATRPTPAAAPRRELAAVRTADPIRLDGELSEAAWQTATPATDFIENRPTPGRPERHRTEARLLYDDAAIYVGAVLHDVAPDSILRELSARDNLGNTDFFGVFFDTYHDGLNGYGFFVTPAGVQLDARYSSAGAGGDDDGGEDFSWNAVWDARTAQQGTDWVVEMRIPHSAVRFSAAAVQEWGINFSRQRQSTRQQFFWNAVRPEVNGFINQSGVLTGLENLHPPLRLSLTPYVSGYLNHGPTTPDGRMQTTRTVNGGADVKWGLNESFTLDATLVPDFGQVQSDNVVLNLSPFEVQFAENRPFFQEGVELFNKGGLFYSRRVGARPIGYYAVAGQLGAGERIRRNPGEARLINAAKLSGRTRGGLGIGVFNGLTRPMDATVATPDGAERDIPTSPLTNYNLVVLDQSLPHNSYVTLVNTNVWRRGATYDANVTGGLFRFADKTNTYALTGRLTHSRRQGRAFGSDEKIDDTAGTAWRAEAGKVSGTWQYSLSTQVETDTYNPNDLALLFNNNSVVQRTNLSYNRYSPFQTPLGGFNNFFAWTGGWGSVLYRPRRVQEAGAYAGFNTTHTSTFTTVEVNVDATPGWQRDFFEPRTEPLGAHWLRRPPTWAASVWVSTDYRRKWAVDASGGYRGTRQAHRDVVDVGFGPRYRFSNQFSLRHRLDWQRARREEGYFGGPDEDVAADAPYVGRLLLGARTRTTVTNTLTATYIFTNRMSLTARGRHYVSSARYTAFFELLEGGERRPTTYARNRDVTFNAVNLDVVFSWWFAPGSEVAIVWKDAIATTTSAEAATPLYFTNLSTTLNAPQNNALSVKVLYFLDWLALRRQRG